MEVFRILGFPISLGYAFVVYLRNFCYDKGIFGTKTFNTPTICVGNVSTGGTGKTPMVEFLITQLQGDYKLAVLSRGYKRKSNGFLLADGQTTVADIGDEPFQIHSKFPETAVAVDTDRARGITILQKQLRPELIVLDDAFQYRKVTYGFYILLTSYDRLFVDDWYLPTGNLRDSKGSAKRANVIVVTKCPAGVTQEQKNRIKQKVRPLAYQQVLFSTLSYNVVLQGDNEVLSMDDLKGKEVTLVTGIADPEPLIDYLLGKGLFVEHLRYPDHHFFTEREIGTINTRKIVLTTEKDFAKLRGKADNLYYISMAHLFLDDGKELLLRAIHTLIR